MFYNNGSNWGYHYPNNMPLTANPVVYPGNYQLPQSINGMGTRPGQSFSGYPSQIVPNGTIESQHLPHYHKGLHDSNIFIGTTQQMAPYQYQQFGSNLASQGQFGSATSANHGGGHLLYATPQQGSGQMAFQQKTPCQNFAQQNLGNAPQQTVFQQTPLDQNFSQQFPANAPQQLSLPLDYPQDAPQEPRQVFTNIPLSAPLHQASGPQVAQVQYPPQPQHQPKSQDKPQKPKLTFEQRIAAFRPVPPPHPEPMRREGRGRKKKAQRFWAPQDANDRVKAKFERLQTVDGRVDLAKRKLDENNEKSKVEHLQDMLLRNMEEREDVWTQCERLKQGLIAIPRELPDAEKEAKRTHEAWKESCQRVSEREAELMQANVRAVQDDNSEAGKKRKKWERESLQSTVNWKKNKWFALEDALESLSSALFEKYGGNCDGAHGDSIVQAWSHVHRLGICEAYSHFMFPGDSEINVWQRQNFSNPDPATWSLNLPPHLFQQQAQHGQVGQPEHDQSAQQPPANHEPVAASVQMGHLPDADDVQMDFSDAQNGQGQQEQHIQEAPMIEGDQEELSDITEEAALAEIEEFNRGPGQFNPEEMFPTAQRYEAPAQIEPSNKEQGQPPQEDSRELTDEQVAYMLGPFDQEQQQPQQRETFEDKEEEGDPAQIEPSNPEQEQLPQEEVPAPSHEEVAAVPVAINQEQQQPQQRETSAATHEKNLEMATWKADQELLRQCQMLMKTPAGRMGSLAGVNQKLQELQQSQGLQQPQVLPVANKEPAPPVDVISPHQRHLLGLSAPFSLKPTDENTNMSADAAAAIDEIWLRQQQERADQARIPEEAQQQDGPKGQDAVQDEGSDYDTEGMEWEEVELSPKPPTRITLMPQFNAEWGMTHT